MSRRSHVVRDEGQAGRGSARTLGGGADIQCAYRGAGGQGIGDVDPPAILVCRLYPTVTWQRYYVTATVSGLTTSAPYNPARTVIVSLEGPNIVRDDFYQFQQVSITVQRGCTAMLTGVFDFEAMDPPPFDMRGMGLGVYPDDWDWSYVYWDSASIQAVKMQAVPEVDAGGCNRWSQPTSRRSVDG